MVDRIVYPHVLTLRFFLLSVFSLWLAAIGSAQATNYTFPTNMPPGCSGSNGVYRCGSLSLGYEDKIIINAPKPASITVNGNLYTNTSRINSTGSAADLTLIVAGQLRADYQAVIQANISAGSISDSSGKVSFGGSLTVTTGSINLNFESTVAGNISSTSGGISVGQNNVVGGSISSVSGAVNIGYSARINGDVSSFGAISTAQDSKVAGKITGATGNVSVGYGSRVSGSITTSSGNISFAQDSVASSCVASTSSATITLGYHTSVNSVCCGSSCSTSCVVNNSVLPMPTQCTPTPSTSLSYFPVPVSPLNENITTWSNGSVYSGKFNGTQTLGGVPFELQTDADGDNVFWGTNLNLSNFRGSSSLTLTLPTNLYGATTIYTLINSAWGKSGSNVGSMTFNASNGDTHTVQLVEGVNVRDHYTGSFANTLSSSAVTLNVIGDNTPNTAHLDMQAFTLPISFQAETLTSIVFTSTGSSSTGLPFLAGVTVQARRLGSVVGTVLPIGFNCVESGANALSGHLYTQLSGTPFAFDVVALKDGNTDGVADAVATTYASDVDRSVKVELVDASSGAACAVLPALNPAVSQTLTFTQSKQTSELGRKSSTGMTVAKAYPNLRCRVIDASQTSPVVGCSTDNFAVRPIEFSLTSSADGSTTVKAGTNFSLTADSGVTGYEGTPKLDTGKVNAHSGAIATGNLTGAFGIADSATGTATGRAFAYSEVGQFALSAQGVYDDAYTRVDAVAGDCSDDFSNTRVGGKFGCKFGNSSTTSHIGRFIPDHFDVDLNTPVFAPACNTFTYIGQPIHFATKPVASFTAKNATGAVTRNYTGSYWKINPDDATYGIKPSYSEAGDALTVLNSNPPVAVDNGNGGGTLSFADTVNNILEITRTNPVAPFNAEIALSFNLQDADAVVVANVNGVATANPVHFGTASTGNGMAFIGTNKTMRWGRLAMHNGYGSELLPLSIPLFVEYFNGSGFVGNVADNCTNLTLNNQLALRNPDTAGGVAQAGDAVMTISPSGSTQAVLLHSTLVAGDAGLSFTAPGAGNTGYIDISGDFAGLPWLLFDWDHDGVHDNSTTARATFGIYKGNSKQIYLREVY